MTAPVAAGSVGEGLSAAVDALAAAGIEAPRLDAELLLAEAMGVDRARLAADPEAAVPPAAARAFGGFVRRRLRREPVAYILGRKGFRRIELEVDRRALIPRPETELLVEVALEIEPRTVLDIGTGCGAIALAVADELPASTVTAIEPSPAALELARENAARLGHTEQLDFRLGTELDIGEFELALANLPYVRDDELDSLAPEIREWEPHDALLGGPDGLDAFRAVVPRVQAEALALEIGLGQAPAVAALMRDAGYELVEARQDLAGIERVLVGRR